MRPDQERVRNLLTDTVTLLCKNGLQYQKELRVQGLLGITLDDTDVFVVHINEKFSDFIGGAISLHSGEDAGKSAIAAEITTTDMSDDTKTVYNDNSKPKLDSDDAANSSTSLSLRKRPSSSASSSSWSEKRACRMKNNSANEMTDITMSPVMDTDFATSRSEFDIVVKTENDVVVIDDAEDIQLCDTTPYVRHNVDTSNTVTSIGELHKFCDVASDDPGGEHIGTQQYTMHNAGSMTASASSPQSNIKPSTASPFFTGFICNRSAAHEFTNDMWSSYGENSTDRNIVSDMAYTPSDAALSAVTAKQTVANVGKVNYPLNHLQGRAIKETIVSYIVSPVVARGDQVYSFRIIWRVDTALLDDAWRSIVKKRELCDDVVRQAVGVQLFVSSITGVFTKSSGLDIKSRNVFPAISYWVVSDKQIEPAQHLLPEFMTLWRDIEIKQISSRHNDVDIIRGPLFVVLKDHNSAYVRQKVECSLSDFGLQATPATLSPAKLVIISAGPYNACMPKDVQRIFHSVNLTLLVDVVDKNDDKNNQLVQVTDT